MLRKREIYWNDVILFVVQWILDNSLQRTLTFTEIIIDVNPDALYHSGSKRI